MKGSHLKPLEQKDTRGGGGFRQLWNTAVHEGNSREGDRGKRGEVGLGEGCGTTPLNGQMFVRDWRRLKSQPSDQYRYYQYCTIHSWLILALRHALMLVYMLCGTVILWKKDNCTT